MFRKIVVSLIFFIFCSDVIHAQTILGQPQFEYSSKSPDVAAIQKMIDVPISPFSGAANINIPLYTIKSRSLSLPISMQYTGGNGIKVDDRGGAVGLGWTFLAGGSITRVVRGNEDEGLRVQRKTHKIVRPIDTPPYTETVYRWSTERDSLATTDYQYGGFYVDGVQGSPGDGSDFYSFLSEHNAEVQTTNPLPPTSHNRFYNGLVDTEPDMFYFNFGEYSGKFVFNGDKTAMLLPYNADLKVTPILKDSLDYTVNSGTYPDTSFYRQFFFESFKISTPDGKDYYFGENSQSRLAVPYSLKPNMYSGWYLTRVVDRINLDTIYIEYAGALQSTYFSKRSQKFVKPSYLFGCQNQDGLNQITQGEAILYFSKIKSANEEIEFFYSSKLDSFRVLDRQTRSLYRKIQFSYGAFNSMKLKLEGIIERDLVTKKYSPYTFSYYDTTGTNSNKAQDFWGYYNGINNSRLMMGYSDSCLGADRMPKWPAMKREVLTVINNPTGGRTELDYEPHTAYTGRNLSNGISEGDAYFVNHGDFNLTNNLIGGLRVKTVKNYDPITKDTLTKVYSYLRFQDGNSSGHLYIPPSLRVDPSSFVCDPVGSPTYYMSTHNMYIGSDANQHVSYRNVTVKEIKNGADNGRIEYEYYDDTNTDSCFYSNAKTDTTNAPITGPYDIYPSWQFKRLPENFLAGREKQKRVYNSAGQLLQNEKSIYKSVVYPVYQRGIVLNSIFKKDMCNSNYISNIGSGMGTTSTCFYMDGQLDIVYDDNCSMMGNVGVRPILPPHYTYYFMYNYRYAKMSIQLSKQIKETYTDKGAVSVDTVSYLYENTDHVNLTSTISRNSRNEVLKQKTFYAWDFSNVNSGDSTIYFMKKAFINIPVASFNYKGSNVFSGGYRQYKWKSRADSTVFLPFEEFALLAGPAGVAPATLNIGSSYPQAFNFPSGNFLKVATYKYNPDNTISYVIKKGNEKISLLWDYNRSFVVAQTAGADSSDIAFTSFETSNNGSWTVAGVARNTTSSVTGKQSYVLSNGNITKSGLSASKSYIVSYWSSSTAATIASTTAVSGDLKNGWRYYEHKLPAAATSVTISGSVTIDELRLHPVGAQMSTYTFNPVVGMTSSTTPDNKNSYYEYDGSGKLRFVRDADRNIIKAADYFYTGFGADTAVWRLEGMSARTKPCPANASYLTGITQYEFIDINPNSATFGQLQWKDISGSNYGPADWQNTATALRCVKNGSNENTGEQEREQKDMNPCSATYNTLRWTSAGTNLTSCPLPPPPCSGPDKMMIGGVCVTGTKRYVSSVWSPSEGKWSCKYKYTWAPDCTSSIDYYEYKTSPCSTSTCIPD